MRAFIHYLFAFLIISLYGGQVCPFIESLNPVVWMVELGLLFIFIYAIRMLLSIRVIESTPYHLQIKRQFTVEIGLLIIAGIIVALFNSLAYGFPASSGAKAFMGFLIFSFFISVDISLERERRIIKRISESKEDVFISNRYMPLTQKFTIVAAVSASAVIIVLFLIFSKDLDWLLHTRVNDIAKAKGAILIEIAFVVIVLLALVFNLIISFSKNLQLFIQNENHSLKEVAEGNLSATVPVSSSDEFGIMAGYTNQMIDSLRDRTEELIRTQDVTIFTLASLAETRDPETGGHIMRTQRYVKILAEYLKDMPPFKDQLNDAKIELIFKSAPLHDIGKVGIPDHILLKPGKLTEEEFEIMKKHTIYGRDAIKKSEEILGQTSFLSIACEIAYSHQEKWDGTGYPEGIKGKAIPLSARLMALADVYDALISKRVYKPPFPHKKAVRIIKEGKGTHFDPDMVDAFLVLADDFRKIAYDFADYDEEKALLSVS